jgi:hypothetical protein
MEINTTTPIKKCKTVVEKDTHLYETKRNGNYEQNWENKCHWAHFSILQKMIGLSEKWSQRAAKNRQYYRTFS